MLPQQQIGLGPVFADAKKKHRCASRSATSMLTYAHAMKTRMLTYAHAKKKHSARSSATRMLTYAAYADVC
jgi:hypothetical protein